MHGHIQREQTQKDWLIVKKGTNNLSSAFVNTGMVSLSLSSLHHVVERKGISMQNHVLINIKKAFLN